MHFPKRIDFIREQINLILYTVFKQLNNRNVIKDFTILILKLYFINFLHVFVTLAAMVLWDFTCFYVSTNYNFGKHLS